jgi:hypothetical protein
MDRFRDNPKCKLSLAYDYIGADDVQECSRLGSQCGYYLKMLIGGANHSLIE